jgi:predicted RNA-binding Zn ribbon-like protein
VIGNQFELIGGNPALDFLNTIHDWTVPEARDYLATFDDALRFAVAAEILTQAEARRLMARPAEGEMRRLRKLRARLERIFRAVVTTRAPSADDLDQLGRDAAEAARSARLRGSRVQVTRALDVAQAGAAVLRWRIIEAAVALLVSAQAGRLRACPACGWFFVDKTKNRSRRWCSMATCGSNAKARRYYWRTKRGRQ